MDLAWEQNLGFIGESTLREKLKWVDIVFSVGFHKLLRSLGKNSRYLEGWSKIKDHWC